MKFIFILFLLSCSSTELEYRYESYLEGCTEASYEILMQQNPKDYFTIQEHSLINKYCNFKTQDKFKSFEPENFFSI